MCRAYSDKYKLDSDGRITEKLCFHYLSLVQVNAFS